MLDGKAKVSVAEIRYPGLDGGTQRYVAAGRDRADRALYAIYGASGKRQYTGLRWPAASRFLVPDHADGDRLVEKGRMTVAKFKQKYGPIHWDPPSERQHEEWVRRRGEDGDDTIS